MRTIYCKSTAFFISALVAISITVDVALANWFLLPGIYYSDDYGLVGSIAFINENADKERVSLGFSYFGEGQGQGDFLIFLPENHSEWTFNLLYQAYDLDAYSVYESFQQEVLTTDTRYWVDLWMRCDFPRDGGIFYGFETAYRSSQFKYGSLDSRYNGYPSPITSIFTDAEEYVFSLRAGLERRDDRYNSFRGTYFLWQIDIGRSDTGFDNHQLIRTQADFRKYIPLSKRNSAIAFNLRGGVIHHQVPYLSQFKMGGSLSLRGFPLNRYYGNGYYLLRTEFRNDVIHDLPSPLSRFFQAEEGVDNTFSLGFALFTEIGDLWRPDLGWWGLRQGVGVGLRAVFPPSVVATIDIATPVDSDHITIYLNIGQSF
ncbi:hypothetical protein CEE37_02940 [candidate division LCP-89 bacterium B3_LCP]|uniref:Bacterial surface antigen (D15) domain-containing protein n=1 Tax=candidate division LCP-89 bacterium B3_LCP TaxID=2012998 RepID=A0A532V2X0_UNCL8|nr:MAG: hypothetical protein CEE37_02940 [candidate division LCP-89 bacterium B3_LCP]